MIIDLTEEIYDGMMVADGFDDAIIGIASRYGQPDVLAYDVNKTIELLIKNDGMSRDDAWEYFEYNILRSYVGETTPVWILNKDMLS